MVISDSLDGIEQYSTDHANQSVQSAASISMLKNTLDMQKMQGAQLTKMMEMSVNPGLGGNIDIRL